MYIHFFTSIMFQDVIYQGGSIYRNFGFLSPVFLPLKQRKFGFWYNFDNQNFFFWDGSTTLFYLKFDLKSFPV
jgi:hypothetical protein